MRDASAWATPRREARKRMPATIMVAAAVVAALGLLLSVRFAPPAEAGTMGAAGPETQRLFDDFDRIREQPDGPWYVINWGSDSRVRAEDEGGVSYLDLSIFPSEEPVSYTNAELAEQETGYAAGEPGRWEPDPGHPVVLDARVRWSPNHEADGSGGAQGTSGIWFWNSPIDGGTYADPYRAFGFSWTTKDSALLQGLNASVVDTVDFGSFSGPYPVWSAAPKAPTDLQAWNDITIRWTENGKGRQSVRFWLNGQYLGVARLAEPYGPLSLELWSDNQVPTFEGIMYANPTDRQSFQVDYVEVTRR